ncbi:MAG: hypothetical protein H7177_03165 [Rhizobacter sp.]|nr:hypothetical protein [Bacteriovorax sp.]
MQLFPRRLPKPIIDKIYIWIELVERIGLPETRKYSGFHDEPLRGDRAGQRSIRLNKGYRLFYIELPGHVIVLKVIEVNKHDY